MDSADIVKRVVDAVQQRDAAAVAALYTEDAVVHHPLYPEPARGRDAIRAGQQELFNTFSDVSVEVRSDLTGENSCAAEVVLRATNTGPIDVGADEPIPATGKRIEDYAVWVFDLSSDGLIVEERDYLDTARLMQQLGLGS